MSNPRTLLLIPLLCAACSSSATHPAGTEPIARAVAAALTTDEYVWTEAPVAGNTIAMMPEKDGFCYLTDVTGDFDSVGQAIYLEIDDGVWTLHGYDDHGPGNVTVEPDNQLRASARCTTWASFTDTPSVHAVLQQGPPGFRMARSMCANNEEQPPCSSAPEVDRTHVVGPGPLCYLSWLGGWLGPGDGAMLNRDAQETMLTVSALDDLRGLSESVAVFGGANCIDFNRGSPLQATQAAATFPSTRSSVPLMPLSQGVCMLSGVVGAMRGRGEEVFVAPDPATGNWVLGGASQQGGITGAAVCLPFAQGFGVPPAPPPPPSAPTNCGAMIQCLGPQNPIVGVSCSPSAYPLELQGADAQGVWTPVSAIAAAGGLAMHVHSNETVALRVCAKSAAGVEGCGDTFTVTTPAYDWCPTSGGGGSGGGGGKGCGGHVCEQ